MQEANEFLVKTIVASSANDELRNKQQFYETSEVEKDNRFKNLHRWLMRDIAQTNVLQYTCFSQLTVLDSVTKPQIIQ